MLKRNEGKLYVIQVEEGRYLYGDIFHNYISFFYATTDRDYAFHFETEEDARAFIRRNGTGKYNHFQIVRC